MDPIITGKSSSALLWLDFHLNLLCTSQYGIMHTSFLKLNFLVLQTRELNFKVGVLRNISSSLFAGKCKLTTRLYNLSPCPLRYMKSNRWFPTEECLWVWETHGRQLEICKICRRKRDDDGAIANENGEIISFFFSRKFFRYFIVRLIWCFWPRSSFGIAVLQVTSLGRRFWKGEWLL